MLKLFEESGKLDTMNYNRSEKNKRKRKWKLINLFATLNQWKKLFTITCIRNVVKLPPK